MERPRRAARPSKYVDISSDEDEDERGSEIVGGSEDEGSEFRDSEARYCRCLLLYPAN